MEIEHIPQDDSQIFRGQKKVIYATQNGRYQSATSSGWNDETFATQQAVEALAEQAEQALQAVKKGEKSMIYYLMHQNRYDLPTLAQATGFWQWQIRRHFKPAVFAALPAKKQAIYADLFCVSVQSLLQASE